MARGDIGRVYDTVAIITAIDDGRDLVPDDRLLTRWMAASLAVAQGPHQERFSSKLRAARRCERSLERRGWPLDFVAFGPARPERLACLVDLAVRPLIWRPASTPAGGIVPVYLMVQKVGLLDSHLALILVYTAFNLSFVTWIMRGFFVEIPIEIEEAALVDGYTRWQIFWRVAVPLVRPGLATTAILSAIFSWNEFLFALILTQSKAATIPVYLAGFSNSMGLAWGEYMAVGSLAVLPIMIFTLVLQRHLVRGLTFGAVR